MVTKLGRRWLVLTQYYPPELGAPQIRLHAFVRELRRNGMDAQVLTAIPNYPRGRIFDEYVGKWKSKEVIDGVPVTRIWIYPGSGRSLAIRLTNYLSFTLCAFAVALARPKPDLMFVEGQPLSLGFIAVALKWLRKVPYIYNVPDLQVDVAREMGFLKNKWLLDIACRLENFFLRESWKVSTVTHRFVKHLRDLGLPVTQTTFLPNGADPDFLRPLPPSRDLLMRWGLHGKKVFLYVGTHAYYHGLDTLIEAATLLRNCADIVFLMVGEGPERARLKQICDERKLENVIFAKSPYDEMNQLYSITYASIATLRNIEVAKSMRLSKIFPSLSCAVPVIFSGFGETAELIESNGCGLVVEPENPLLLAEAITKLAYDPELRSALGYNGRTLVEKDYSWSAIVERWLTEIGMSDKLEDGCRAYSVYATHVEAPIEKREMGHLR